MKKRIFLYFALCFPVFVDASPLNVSVKSEAAILINAETGAVLYEKNPHKRYHPASITKIATAAFALKMREKDLDKLIVAPQDCIVSVSEEAKQKAKYSQPAHWLVPGGCHIGIKKGEELSLKDLMYGMMLASANDASNVIAHHVSGSVPDFMKQMNSYLKEIGCENTKFFNPHGLHHPEHHSTAYDMALITREALKYPIFKEIVSTVRYRRPTTDKQEGTTIVQKNKLLHKGDHYNPKAIGVKTGYIAAASHTFVGAAEGDDRTLIAVVLKSKEREGIFRDTNKLFEAAFNESKVKKTYVKVGPQKHEMNLSKPVKTKTDDELSLEFYPSEEPQVKCLLLWDMNVALPIAENQRVGEIRLCTMDGEVLKSAPLLALEMVKPSLFASLKEYKISFLGVFIAITFVFLLSRRVQ